MTYKKRQKAVMRLHRAGYTTWQTARILGIDRTWVESYLLMHMIKTAQKHE